MELPCDLDQMNAQQLHDLTASLIQTVNQQTELLKSRQLKIDQLTHEMATLKRWRFARRSVQLDAVQRSLLEESIDEDLQAIELELEALRSTPEAAPPLKGKPRRVMLPGKRPIHTWHDGYEVFVLYIGCPPFPGLSWRDGM
jgi:transposase